ncbi:LysR family transcriptional regulator [Ovoidimarina sediminis]|uniref:LysR family transcriptional regulator n=1 Tax=Ovoidimarina sediminis TaxID=3079856 RepID=UPI00290D9EDC|nr:LysR family transcriptional regulator [Rhodophyticola sp. MJ-SS7]MDU8945293.1 LysR family transcriptional regulator [Rhodophyticola sp. MJ-SS7]
MIASRDGDASARPEAMERSPLSIKWLEAFQSVARHGTVRDGAAHLGVSMSTVSHHLSCLEDALGVALLDHGRRPMRLTVAGETLLRRVDEALWLLGMGISDIWSDDLASLVRRLRVAHIEDFDTDVGPEMLHAMVEAMPRCDFSALSRPTHEILDLLQAGQVDVGLASSMEHERLGLIEEPLLRDPFILVVPASLAGGLPDLQGLALTTDELPFLRYSKTQLIGRQIEAQLRRLGMRYPERMEFESTHMILSMVAAGRGWTITSALTFARAQRYHAELRALPFPGKAFTRRISLYCREDLPESIRGVIDSSVRNAVLRRTIDPMITRYPWLAHQFALIAPAPATTG